MHCKEKNLSNHNETNSSLHSESEAQNYCLKMSDKNIPVPKDRWKDEVNTNFFCCFRTRSWRGTRINGYRVVKKSFDEKEQLFILRLKGHELVVTLSKDLIKSLHVKKDDTYGFMDLENEMVNGCRVVNKSYVENGPSFVLNLDGQVEPVTVSKDLVRSLYATIEPKVVSKLNKNKWTQS